MHDQITMKIKIIGFYDEISGRIDRLVVDDAQITIIDYKSGKQTIEISDKYKQQISQYAKFLQKIYPNHEVIAKIVWLDTGKIELACDVFFDTIVKTNIER